MEVYDAYQIVLDDNLVEEAFSMQMMCILKGTIEVALKEFVITRK
jgi:hypothetical protein